MEFIGELGQNWYHAQTESQSVAISPDGNIVALTASMADKNIGIYDVSDPENIIELSQWGEEGESYSDVEFIDQDTIAIAAGAYGVHFLDISDTANPEYITQWDIDQFGLGVGNNNAKKIEVHSDGDELLIVDDDYGLQYLDITDINNPVLSWTTGEWGTEAVDGIFLGGIAGLDDYAIQSTSPKTISSNHTLNVYHLEDLDNPEEISSQNIFIDLWSIHKNKS
mgnify:CR=1 FL=1